MTNDSIVTDADIKAKATDLSVTQRDTKKMQVVSVCKSQLFVLQRWSMHVLVV